MATADNFEIIKHLSQQEQIIVNEYLKKFKPIGLNKKNEYKEELLFQILSKEKNVSDAELSKRLEVKRIDMLKSNLFTKIIEALTQDRFISNVELFSKNDQTVFKLKKQLLAIRILYRNLTRDKTNSILKLLDELIKNAIKNEVYEITIEALQLKKYTTGIRFGIKEFEKIDSEIEF
jgi:ribosomal protein S8